MGHVVQLTGRHDTSDLRDLVHGRNARCRIPLCRVKEDFSDLPEKLQYYIEHPEQAEDIIRHAHEYIRQFQDKERENLISLMVLDKYFRLSGQQ